MNIETLFEKYNNSPKGIIQAGSHHAEEYKIYLKYLDHNILLFEPQPEAFLTSVEVARKATVANLALGSFNGLVDLFIPSSHNASASVLVPRLHLLQYPQYVFDSSIRVHQVRLDDFMEECHLHSRYDTLILDVQGYELEVIKGAVKTMADINFVFTEVNREELYFGCVLFDDLEQFMYALGFQLLEIEWFGGTWGNAIYGRNRR